LGADRPAPDRTLCVVLALASGATDAFGYLRLGGTFTSVMTGNMVLLAVAAAHAHGALIVRTGAAICAYLGGAALAVRLAGATYAKSPDRTLRRLLHVELALFVLYAVTFQIAGLSGHLGVQVTLLVLAAIALGTQSSAVQSYQVSGLSTTFLTGTLTTVAIHLAQGRPLRHSARSLFILGGLLAGAAGAAGLAFASPRAGAFLPAALVACAVLRLGATGGSPAGALMTERAGRPAAS
jgi:uncharacterized membrane protein YoaK (UPF0700 family)